MLSSLFWIIAGVIFVLYNLVKDGEANLVIGIIIAIVYYGIIGSLPSFGLDSNATWLVWLLTAWWLPYLVCLVVLSLVDSYRTFKKNARQNVLSDTTIQEETKPQ